jgi:hypothetical protein
METKQLVWEAFESLWDLRQKHEKLFDDAFKKEFQEYTKEYDGTDTPKDEILSGFVEEYLMDNGEWDAFLKVARYMAEKRKYKAVIIDIRYFGEYEEKDGVPKHVIDIMQVIPQTREELVALVELYCEETKTMLPEIIVEKLVPQPA